METTKKDQGTKKGSMSKEQIEKIKKLNAEKMKSINTGRDILKK